jgi:hypothetical protein
LKLESSITTARVPSDFVMCTSYAAPLSELSVSVVALSTVAPGFAAIAAADAEDKVEPVSGVSPFPFEYVPLPLEEPPDPLDEELELPLDEELVPLVDVAAVVCLWACFR